MTNSVQKQLEDHLQTFETLPFLFVGSGFSRRYIGLESWKDLLERYAQLTERPYGFYTSSASSNLPEVATRISEVFHDIWWTSKTYAESRRLYEAEASLDQSSALKIEIAKDMLKRGEEVTDDRELRSELATLEEASIDGIITTNWDTFLETVFPTFHKYVGQNELLFSTPYQVAEIYKIHGCCTQPNSMVLTSADYAAFEAGNPYLIAKLLTIFIEHPVIFIGYSLTDENIRKLLTSLVSCLNSHNIYKLQDRLIFIEYKPGTTEATLRQNIIVTTPNPVQIPVITITTEKFQPVFAALKSLKRPFPAKLLRQLKEHIYTLVQTNDPNGQLRVANIEGEPIENLRVVYGVGKVSEPLSPVGSSPSDSAPSEMGYRRIGRDDIVQDVLDGEQHWDPSKILLHSLPSLTNGRVPIYKYLREAGHIDNKGQLDHAELLSPRLVNLVNKQTSCAAFYPGAQNIQRLEKVRAEYGGIRDMAERAGPEATIVQGAYLEDYVISVQELRTFLLDHLDMLGTSRASDYRRMACLYDYLVNRKQVTR